MHVQYWLEAASYSIECDPRVLGNAENVGGRNRLMDQPTDRPTDQLLLPEVEVDWDYCDDVSIMSLEGWVGAGAFVWL